MDKRYLKIYSSQNDYDNNWLNDLEEPHVVYIEETDEVIFKDVEPKVDYSTQYFTLEAIEDTEFSFELGSGVLENNTLFYSIDNGEQWEELVIPDDEADVAKKICDCKASEKVLLKAEGVMEGSNISSSANFNICGNAMSLLYGDDFIGQTNLEGKNNCFNGLFYGNTNLISAENLILPATTLVKGCYHGMFGACTSLTTAPELPATTLAERCYNGMFGACTSLTTAPELLATTLAERCYFGMFAGCTSLTTAPELLATRLTDWCYSSMFNGCSKLNYIKMLATSISASGCLNSWVYGVASNGTFVKNANATWNVTGSNGIPNGWTVETA